MNRRDTVTIVISNNKTVLANSVDASFAESFLLIVLIPFVMGTKLNKIFEKRKNISGIILLASENYGKYR